MRQNKFRAWDSVTKQMFYGDKVPVFHEEDNGGLHSGYNDKGGDWVDLTLMQFTGLHDKNGKEIYEGDVVKAVEDICLVAWNQKFASFVLTKDGWMYNHYFGEAVDPEDCEVIGNIYENSELLETTPKEP